MIFDLTQIDRHFARFVTREAGDAPPWFETLAALVSNAVGSGHVCLDLPAIAGRPLVVDTRELVLPPLHELLEGLETTPVVGRPGEYRPFVLDPAARLYLYRYWDHEQNVARVVREKAAAAAAALDETLLSEGIRRLFGTIPAGEIDWQVVAAVAAMRKTFAVISGGPGTGKTSTVVKILALLLEQPRERQLRIALAAPTGKAAARLKESIALMKGNLPCTEEVRAGIPDTVVTIHGLLGSIGGSSRFRHGPDNRLPHDVIILDEASMVALPLMSKLVLALREEARLILLGDRDQLASVEAGAILGDICGRTRTEPFTCAFSEQLRRLTGIQLPAESVAGTPFPLSDALVVLKKNYRFSDESGINVVGSLVREGEGGAAFFRCREGVSGISWRELPPREQFRKMVADAVMEHCRSLATASSPEEMLCLLEKFAVLCALRRGPLGVTAMNELIEGILRENGVIPPHGRWYRGRPVMVTVNDYAMKLFNGDVGVVFPDPAEGSPKVWFSAPGGGLMKVSPLRLPPHETVYAMTVHKSQGSEFDRILLLLSENDSPVLTRELLYTGITRARRSVEIWGTEQTFLGAVLKRIERRSGLEEALWQDDNV